MCRTSVWPSAQHYTTNCTNGCTSLTATCMDPRLFMASWEYDLWLHMTLLKWIVPWISCHCPVQVFGFICLRGVATRSPVNVSLLSLARCQVGHQTYPREPLETLPLPWPGCTTTRIWFYYWQALPLLRQIVFATDRQSRPHFGTHATWISLWTFGVLLRMTWVYYGRLARYCGQSSLQTDYMEHLGQSLGQQHVRIVSIHVTTCSRAHCDQVNWDTECISWC